MIELKEIVRSTAAGIFALLSFGAACDPVVYSSHGTYELTDVSLLDADGRDLGTLSGQAAPGTSVTVEASIQLHLLGSYELNDVVILTATPPIGPSVTMRMPFNDSGDWDQNSDTELRLTSKDGSVSTMTLEERDGSKVSQTLPTSKFGTFPPPFSWMNDKLIEIRMKKLPAPS